MSWFNFHNKDGKPRKIDIEFEDELNRYYAHIRSVTTPEQASEIPPDVDEFREDRSELKTHPENEDFARLGLVKVIPSALYIDPANPPQKITEPKHKRSSKIRDKEYTNIEMETIYKLNNPTEKQRLTEKQSMKGLTK